MNTLGFARLSAHMCEIYKIHRQRRGQDSSYNMTLFWGLEAAVPIGANSSKEQEHRAVVRYPPRKEAHAAGVAPIVAAFLKCTTLDDLECTRLVGS